MFHTLRFNLVKYLIPGHAMWTDNTWIEPRPKTSKKRPKNPEFLKTPKTLKNSIFFQVRDHPAPILHIWCAARPRRGRGRGSQMSAATATWRGASCGATRRARTARRATRGRTARARCPSPRPIACPARTPRRAAEDAGAAAPNKGTTPTRTAARGARDGGGSRSGSGKPATSAHEYDLDTT